ncbi:alpha-ketoglutarate-dependent dioxygenase AlkB family protein [Mucilaginibacter terrae]|uniref:Alkylated DNA repair dioxygenase AlkB n=1 Tax=Mucilaginibacter terrae TaxID=1955052 RepID=A0ABU3GXA7_9SPHI|nr:alpha-ketoglutarate-dependent dioxygenase AlkB [Mucilaginibacter terrae]MDT3404290.1 alkylated DNA repair dioxygenase AlkB [Mucilaginibacter terrae]
MDQLNMFGGSKGEMPSPKIHVGINKVANGEFCFFPSFFNKLESDDFFQVLRKNISWKQESMNMYGKKIPFPRLTAWYGDQDKPYSFSGLTLKPQIWTNELLEIRARIEPVANVRFNSVLLNLYRSGNDSISWHTDAEKELGINPVIASVNFGETRTFQLRHIKTKEKIEIHLTHGSLLIMKGETQHFWQHQIPKTSKVVRERINLTFRFLI